MAYQAWRDWLWKDDMELAYRKFMLKKQHTQPKRILRKGGGRLSVNIHNASEMAVHEFHPSFSRRSTAVSDVLRFKS